MPGAASGPQTSAIFDVALPERMTAIVVSDGSQPAITWLLTNPATGAAVDLTPYADNQGNVAAALRLREATWSGSVFTFTPTGTVGGSLVTTLDLTKLCGPGIFIAEIAVLDQNQVPSAINRFYLVNERSLWSRADSLGPYTFQEIRLHLRDSSPGENRLLDTREFDDAEIARCVVQALEYWNNTLPPLRPFTTQNFPFRATWLQGTVALLQKLAAEWYRKNRLDYSAGGIQVGDLSKADEYDRQADQAWADYKATVQSRKVAINMESAWGSASSPYASVGRYGGW